MECQTERARIRVQIFDDLRVSVSERWLREVALRALGACGPSEADGRPGLDVVLADDDTVRELNRRFAALDETTDVLAFPFGRQGEYHGDDGPQSNGPDTVEFVTPPEAGHSLGEVIISYPTALRQAEQSGHDVERELALLLTHGVLHLLGYDHAEPDQEVAMKAKEALLLAQVLGNE